LQWRDLQRAAILRNASTAIAFVMSELLEILFNVLGTIFEVLLEVIFGACDASAGWRFYVSFLGSLAVAALLLWLLPAGRFTECLCGVAVVAGVVGGFVWECRNR